MRRTLTSTLALLAAVAFAASAVAQSAILGRLLNGTTGGVGRAERINLIRLGDGMSTVKSLTDVDGSFQFDLDAPGPYMIQAQSHGSTYMARVPPTGSGTATVEITLFDVSADPTPLRLGMLHLVAIVDGKTLRIAKVYEILNPTGPPVAIVGEPGAFRFDMPDDATLESAAITSLGMPLRQEPTDPASGPGKTIAQAIKPGRTRYELNYELPYSGSVLLEETLYHATDRVSVIVVPETVTVAAVGLTAEGVVERDGIRYQSFSGGDLAAGSRVSLSLSGQAVAPRMPDQADDRRAPTDGRIDAVENRIGRGTRKYLVASGALLLLLLVMVATRLRPSAGVTDAPAVDAVIGKLLGRIAALDDRHSLGETEVSQHQKERAELVGRVREELARRTGVKRSA